MAQELECKIKLTADESAALAEKLRGGGAEFLGEVFERNWLFDRRGIFLAKHETLRLRIINNETRGLLTRKLRPQKNSRFKCREEIETVVEDAENMRTILQSLKFSPRFYYEKKRATYRRNDCEIVIDELPEMGTFVEIEAPDANKLEAALKELSLTAAADCNASYSELWQQFCAANREFPADECKFR